MSQYENPLFRGSLKMDLKPKRPLRLSWWFTEVSMKSIIWAFYTGNKWWEKKEGGLQ